MKAGEEGKRTVILVARQETRGEQMRRFGWLSMVIVIAVTLLQPVSASAGASSDSPCWRYRDSERKLATKVNAARERQGLGKLSLDPELSRVARLHSWEMIGERDLFHTSLSLLGRRVTRWSALAENVGRGRTLREVFRDFMRSPTHQYNILKGTFRHFGVSVVRRNGRLWVTVVFESVLDPGTTLSMPRCG